jgi:hypothetical protein
LQSSFRFFGPYKILDKIGAVAYKLLLAPSSAIHPVFHVSQLKASHGQQVVTDVLPDELVPFQVPQAILDHCFTTRDPPAEEVLIQWSRMPPSLATWELLVPLKQHFPRAPAWGHTGSQGEGIVSVSAPSALKTNPKEASTSQQARPARECRPNVKISGPEWLG